MLVAFIIVAVIAAGLLVLLLMGQQKTTRITAERDDVSRQLSETGAALDAAESRIATLEAERQELIAEGDRLRADGERLRAEGDGLRAEGQRLGAEGERLRAQGEQLAAQVEESASTLRKRTELADAQAMQIDTLSAARDELQQQLNSAEERIVTLAARPGVVVGEFSAGDANAEMLWGLELARSERAWRNSVAINPVDDASPFESTDDPVRTAVEVEAQALREDVGAMITVDWKADRIESSARRLMVLRVAQEMLALASKAPGAARLVVSQSTEDAGSLTMEFEADDNSEQVINLIPPQISSDLIDVSRDSGVSVTVKAE